MAWHLTHTCILLSLPRSSNQRTQLVVEKPVESAANFVSTALSGIADCSTMSRRIGVRAASSM